MATDVSKSSGGAVESKGLKAGALGLVSATVVGVASAAPAYSLAAVLGFVVAAGVGFKSPAVMWISFIPMGCIAVAFFYLNRADPDCGTNFTWVTRAIGPRWGWMGGWSSAVADLLIMPNLAAIAAIYTLSLFGFDSQASSIWWQLGLGCVFIMGMTWICVVGIELSARTQFMMLATELAILIIFSVVALAKVWAGSIHGSVSPSLSWLVPTNFGGTHALVEGMLLAVFIYWGWDTATSVNEECEEPNQVPGVAGILATVVLVLIYVLVTFAAQAAKGPNFLADPANSGDVFAATGAIVFGTTGIGWWALKLLLLAVLSSSAASCQTTILPAARTALSMAMHRAAPAKFGEVSPRYLTPAWSSMLFGIISCVWFAVLTIITRYYGGNVLGWSITAVGVMICYYYGQCGIACVIYYRRYLFKSLKNFIYVGVLPAIGGLTLAYLFVRSLMDMSHADYTDPPATWLGVNPVMVIGLGMLLLGLPLMFWWNTRDHAFFRVKADPIDSRPPPEGGDPLPPLVAEGAPK
jgi:amino acid transporter